MDNKKVILTKSGLDELEQELYTLKVTRRKDVAEKIKEARAQGDLSENAEYDAAKDEQAEIEARIAIVEKMLRNADIIDEDTLDGNLVGLGSKVKVFDFEFEEELYFTLVGSIEADPMSGKISNESQLGIELLGKAIDDIIEYETPAGTQKFKILEISK